MLFCNPLFTAWNTAHVFVPRLAENERCTASLPTLYSSEVIKAVKNSPFFLFIRNYSETQKSLPRRQDRKKRRAKKKSFSGNCKQNQGQKPEIILDVNIAQMRVNKVLSRPRPKKLGLTKAQEAQRSPKVALKDS